MKSTPVTIIGKFYRGYAKNPVFIRSEFVEYAWSLDNAFVYELDLDGNGKEPYWCNLKKVEYMPKTATIELTILVEGKYS